MKSSKKNFMAPFYGWDSAASKLELLWGGNLFFTTTEIEYTSVRVIGSNRSSH